MSPGFELESTATGTGTRVHSSSPIVLSEGSQDAAIAADWFEESGDALMIRSRAQLSRKRKAASKSVGRRLRENSGSSKQDDDDDDDDDEEDDDEDDEEEEEEAEKAHQYEQELEGDDAYGSELEFEEGERIVFKKF